MKNRKTVNPPAMLIDRVRMPSDATDAKKEEGFIESGMKSLGEMERLCAFAGIDLDSPVAVLDWGCGPGRVTLRLIEQHPALNVTGIDVDEGAIDWLSAQDLDAKFLAIETEPPIPFEDGSFDLCVNHSVLTHIDRPAQRAWLAEIARVLKPGGHFVTSVHGPSVLLQTLENISTIPALSERWISQWQSDRFVWAPEDAHTGSIHHDGYHTTFQHPATVEELSGYRLETRIVWAQGDLGFQDMIVLRRRTDDEASHWTRITNEAVSEPDVTAHAGLTESELSRNWMMAAGSLSEVGRSLARLENEIIRLRADTVTGKRSRLRSRA